MALTPALLQALLEQTDEKHVDAHKRLRRDLTEGLNDMSAAMDDLVKAQRVDHDTIVRHQAEHDRRKELSGTNAVIMAACIGGGFRLVEVLVTAMMSLVKGH